MKKHITLTLTLNEWVAIAVALDDAKETRLEAGQSESPVLNRTIKKVETARLESDL